MACSEETRSDGSPSQDVFLPPTLVTGLVETNKAQSTVISLSSSNMMDVLTLEPKCSNQLKYISDVSIPDGTRVKAGEILDKRWLVENDGTCNWNQDYRLKLVAGSDLGAAVEQALFPARSGIRVVIRIQFTAPSIAAAYRSAWQAFSPLGEPFGDPIFIDIVVVE